MTIQPFTGAPTRDIGTPDLSWGTWGQGLLSDWWETAADLIWPQSVVTYGRMRHDPKLRGVLSALTLPLMRATWAVDPLGAAGPVVQRVADDLGLPVLGSDDKPKGARRRGVIWRRHLREALFCLIYGHMPFELRYDITGTSPGDCHLIHLGGRMPWTIAQINLAPDSTIDHIVQTTQQEPIPGDRLVWYSYGQEGANWAGISVMRPAFGAWLLKHETWRVHATSIRRFGMGVPTVTAPPGSTVAQVNEAQAMASAMRAGDQSGAGLPSGFTFALTGLTGSVPDAQAFIQYLDQQMSVMALAGVLDLGQTETGSRALGESFLDLFLLALQGLADEVATTATSGQEGTKGIVTDLVDVNWGPDEPCPAIVCTDVGESYQITAEALGELARYGTLTPDAGLDDWIRKTWRLPKRTTIWQPSHLGLPAPGQPGGAFLPPGAIPAPFVPTSDDDLGDLEPAWDPSDQAPAPPPGTPPGPEGQNPSGPQPAPGGAPAPAPPGPAPRARRRPRAASGVLRRKPNAHEVAAGTDPETRQRDWQAHVDGLLGAYRAVVAAQRKDIVDQVVAAIGHGRTDALAGLSTNSEPGAALIAAAMSAAADQAASRMITEAASQGVTVIWDKVKIDTGKLEKVAAARAALAAAYLCQQAGGKALQVSASLMDDAMANGDQIDSFLAGLSDTPLADQLGAAMTAAQNTGRVAVLEAAPESAGQAVYYASEILDRNTCDPCAEIDGTELGTLDDAEAAYPTGGYIDCEGGMRCRGTVVAVWGGGESESEGEGGGGE